MNMKKLFGVTLLVTCLGILLPLISEDVRIINQVNAAEKNGKILLFIRQGTVHNNERMIAEEVNVMSRMLEEAGFDVTVASASGEALEGHTTKLIPDILLADVNVGEYVGIMLPCFALGSASTGWHASPGEISLVKEAVSLGKPIAAQHGAVIMLVEAGALAGKKYAYPSNLVYHGYDKELVDAVHSTRRGVVQDGGIITSSHCPYYGRDHGTVELTELFIAAMQK